MKRILFVCTGNTCRSPMAAALFKRRLEGTPSLRERVEVLSAGTSADEGAPPTEEAIQVMKEQFIDLSAHRARQLTSSLLDQVDLILTMTDNQKKACINAGASEEKVQTLGEFAGMIEEVEDPFGRGLPAYEDCVSQLERLIEGVVQRLLEEDPSIAGVRR